MQKRTIIKTIRTIINNCGGGEVSSADMELNSSPCLRNYPTFNTLVEVCGLHKVTVVHYVNDEAVGEDYIPYEELEKDILEEILFNFENYEVDVNKTIKRCQS